MSQKRNFCMPLLDEIQIRYKFVNFYWEHSINLKVIKIFIRIYIT